MKKIKLVAITCVIACACISATAQDKKQKHSAAELKSPDSKPDPATAERAWMQYMTPGPMHEMLARSSGEWKEEVTTWMAPDAPPTKSVSNAHNEMIMGGRYQQSMHRGDFNGVPFEGMSIVGYDNALKMYISTWVDNMGTGIMYLKGTYDEKTRMLTSTGKMVDPVSGKEINVKETILFVDDNTQVMEMFDMKEGKENKTMEIKFTR